MKKHLKANSGQTVKPIVAVGIGVLISIIVTMVSSAVAALLITKGSIQYETIQRIIWLIQFFSGTIGCLISTILAGNKPAIISAVCAAAYITLLLAGNIVFIKGKMEGVLSGIIAVLCGACIPILLRMTSKKNRGVMRHH